MKSEEIILKHYNNAFELKTKNKRIALVKLEGKYLIETKRFLKKDEALDTVTCMCEVRKNIVVSNIIFSEESMKHLVAMYVKMNKKK